MKKNLKEILLVLVALSFFGCGESSNKQANDGIKAEISKRENSNTYFKSTDEKIDSKFDKKKFYVPVYSHLFLSENKYTRLSISLSIRNSDQIKDLYIESIDYYNTEGTLVKKYLSQPHILKPMASIDYVVNLEDMTGGNGAKFLVNVATKDKTNEPIIQAIMTNTLGNSNLCFLTQGYIVE